ncbi:MAG: YkvA family protein [Tannerellaceae bacterium]
MIKMIEHIGGYFLKTRRSKAIFWLVLAILYSVLPFDLIPDVPVLGWIDDLFILGAAVLNLVEMGVEDRSRYVARILFLLKWIFLTIGVLLILFIMVFASVMSNILLMIIS